MNPYIVIKHRVTIMHLVLCIKCFVIDTAYLRPSLTHIFHMSLQRKYEV